jgi:hypothetical protein
MRPPPSIVNTIRTVSQYLQPDWIKQMPCFRIDDIAWSIALAASPHENLTLSRLIAILATPDGPLMYAPVDLSTLTVQLGTGRLFCAGTTLVEDPDHATKSVRGLRLTF